ncbi:MAG: hypothetical protein ACR2H0_02230 [Candidatus Limnocylindrales bacterium]
MIDADRTTRFNRLVIVRSDVELSGLLVIGPTCNPVDAMVHEK